MNASERKNGTGQVLATSRYNQLVAFERGLRLRGIASFIYYFDGVVLLVKGEGMNEIFNDCLDNWIIDVNDEVNISNQALQSKNTIVQYCP